MRRMIALILTMLLAGSVLAQVCKVLKPEIADSYQGGCKDGLAQGKGVAKGVDEYEGEFKKGLPDGLGTYRWSDGAVYEGYWKKGIREGRGRYVWHTNKGDSTLTGVWRKDRYEGSGIPPYQVGRTESIPRYSVKAGLAPDNTITFRFMRSGGPFSQIDGLNVSTTSGTQEISSTYLIIRHAVFPVTLKLTFSAPSQLNATTYPCEFNITLNQVMSWEIVLNI